MQSATKDILSIKFSTLFKTFMFLSLACLFTSCGKKALSIEGFDPIAWQQKRMVDTDQCISYRKENYKILLDKEKELIGRDDSEILEFLGTPDQESLSGRLKKSKMYCIQGCELCEKESPFKKYLVIDFETFKRIKSVRIVVEASK